MGEIRLAGTASGRPDAELRPRWSQAMTMLRAVLVVVGVAAVLWLLYELRSVILLLVLSVFFAYLIAPLVALVARPFRFRGRERRLSPGIAVGVVYLALIGVIAETTAWLVPRVTQQATQMTGQAPAYIKALQGQAQSLTGVLDRVGLPPDARETVQRSLGTLSGSIETSARHFAMGLVGVATYVPWLVLIPVIAFFLLKDVETFRGGLIGLLPSGRMRLEGSELFERINAALAGYVRAQLLGCVLIGVVVGVGFALLGVPYSAMLGVLAGLAEFVPLVGPLAIAVVAAVLAGLHSPLLAVWVLLFLGALRIVEDYIIYPRLVGTRIDLHPLAIIVAVLAGAELGGVAGIFLSVPVLAILAAIWQQFSSQHPTIETPEGSGRAIAGDRKLG